jgi:virginiamycin B lyase
MGSTAALAHGRPPADLSSCISETQSPVPVSGIPAPDKFLPTETIGIHLSQTTGKPIETSGPATSSVSTPCLTEYALPAGETSGFLTLGPDGNIWFTATDHVDRLLTKPPYTVTSFPMPKSGLGMVGIAPGPDGNLWFATYTGQIGRILTEEPNTVTLFTIPDGGEGQQIVAGPDGAMWFAEYGDRIGRISVTPPYKIDQFTIPLKIDPSYGSNAPVGITVGPDNNIWFTEELEGNIGRILTYGNHEITEFPVFPTPTDDPTDAGLLKVNGGHQGLYSIISGADGYLWFSTIEGNTIGKINAYGNHEITQFPLEDTTQTTGIAVGTDGYIYFTGNGPDYRTSVGAVVGRLTPKAPYTFQVYYNLYAHGVSMVADPHSRDVWFTDGDHIGRIRVPCGQYENCRDEIFAGR